MVAIERCQVIEALGHDRVVRSQYLLTDRQGYQRALEAAQKARAKTKPEGRSYVDYWIGRLEFGMGYLDTIAAVRRAGGEL